MSFALKNSNFPFSRSARLQCLSRAHMAGRRRQHLPVGFAHWDPEIPMNQRLKLKGKFPSPCFRGGEA